MIERSGPLIVSRGVLDCLVACHMFFTHVVPGTGYTRPERLAVKGNHGGSCSGCHRKYWGGGERVMVSIGEYGKSIGVKIETFDGNFYVSLRDYEKLLKELKESREKDDVLSEKNERK